MQIKTSKSATPTTTRPKRRLNGAIIRHKSVQQPAIYTKIGIFTASPKSDQPNKRVDYIKRLRAATRQDPNVPGGQAGVGASK